jgi:hypothetical protein
MSFDPEPVKEKNNLLDVIVMTPFLQYQGSRAFQKMRHYDAPPRRVGKVLITVSCSCEGQIL